MKNNNTIPEANVIIFGSCKIFDGGIKICATLSINDFSSFSFCKIGDQVSRLRMELSACENISIKSLLRIELLEFECNLFAVINLII